MSAVDEPQLGVPASNDNPEPPADPASVVSSLTSEFEPMVPELRPGGTVVVGESEFQLRDKRSPGIECRVRPLRTRHLLLIGRILTGSPTPINIWELLEPIREASPDEELTAIFAAAAQLLLKIPNSEDEFLQFVSTIVDPFDRLDTEQAKSFIRYMDDPDPIDTTRIIAQVFVNERPRFTDLGKALTAMFPVLGRLPGGSPAQPST